MIAIFLKWGIVLGLIVALVFGFSSKQIRTPALGFLRKYALQIILIVVVYVAIITYSLIGT